MRQLLPSASAAYRSFSDWNPYNHGPSTVRTKKHEASKTGFSSATARVCISRCATPRHARFYFTLYDILTRADHPVWRIYVRQPLLLHSPSLASSRMRRFEKRRARRHARRHRDDGGGSGVAESRLVFCSRGVVGLAAVFASPIVCGDEETRGDTRVGVSRNVSSSPSRAVAASAVSRRARRRRTSFSASAAFCSSPLRRARLRTESRRRTRRHSPYRCGSPRARSQQRRPPAAPCASSRGSPTNR